MSVCVHVATVTQQKDNAVKMALKRELQVMSVENRLKRVRATSTDDTAHDDDDDNDDLPLLYPSDADQVSNFVCCFLFYCLSSCISVYCISV